MATGRVCLVAAAILSTARPLRRKYLRRIGRLLRVRCDPSVLVHYLVKCAMHYHHHQMARQMASARSAIVNSF
jgi:hypothetical protein